MSKRYYWIKLKTDFFEENKIKWLSSQPYGAEYIVLFLKLCLLTANDGGRLAMNVGEMIIPYNIEMIASDTKTPIDVVESAMNIFENIGLIAKQDDTEISVIPYVSDSVGSESDSAIRVRKHRKKKALQCNEEIDIEIDIEKDIDIDVDVDNSSVEKSDELSTPDDNDYDNRLQKFKRHIFLSENQIGELLDKLGKEMFDEYINRLDNYVEKTGHKMKNHYETMLKWYNEDRTVKETASPNITANTEMAPTEGIDELEKQFMQSYSS